MSIQKTKNILALADHCRRVSACHKVLLTPNENILSVVRRSATTLNKDDATKVDDKVGISKAMQAYLERSKEEATFMTTQVNQYEIGKRHLANMMGENPDTFSQEDVDNAIAYLLPSGLHDPRARPLMKHPLVIFPKRKMAEFDSNGRPFHSLFYTGFPTYYQILQDIAVKAQRLDQQEEVVKRVARDENAVTRAMSGSAWVNKVKFEKIMLEKVSDQLYEFFIRSMDRLVAHPNFVLEKEKEFLDKFRVPIKSQTQTEVPQLLYTDTGVPYMTCSSRRKMAFVDVTVYGNGSGKFDINGKDILYFQQIMYREQVLFPLQFTEMWGKVDIVAKLMGGGPSCQSSAMRYSIAQCLRSFVDDDLRERMRLAGLLTFDVRQRERKRPGRKGRRALFTWKAR